MSLDYSISLTSGNSEAIIFRHKPDTKSFLRSTSNDGSRRYLEWNLAKEISITHSIWNRQIIILAWKGKLLSME